MIDLEILDLTLEKISELCTTESYKRGMQYFQEGAVDKIEYISRRVSEWQ